MATHECARAATVRHVQVAMIVLDVFGRRRRAATSQLPMRGLTVAFTVAGLWILAQPTGAG